MPSHLGPSLRDVSDWLDRRESWTGEVECAVCGAVHMPGECEEKQEITMNQNSTALRAFIDGDPLPSMIESRDTAVEKLSSSSWQSATESLAEAAFESGYDAAILAASDAIRPLINAARAALDASYHSEMWANPTMRKRLREQLERFEYPINKQSPTPRGHDAAQQ